ncbi:hypothetical protein GCM10023168_00270 [Fodinibacter luteus]|uniref:Uncharacterized protein n=1 Tax=Fodinibacter luteus TaxID=552064 RepID=A0ABP8JVJ0_9MICO
MTSPSTPPTPREDTLADEVFVDDTRTTPQPPPTPGTTPATASAAQQTTTQPTTTQPTTAATEPTYLRGPAPFAVVLGILGLVIAGATLVAELTDLSVPWTDLGPWSVVAAGLVVLMVGATGLRGSRTRD